MFSFIFIFSSDLFAPLHLGGQQFRLTHYLVHTFLPDTVALFNYYHMLHNLRDLLVITTKFITSINLILGTPFITPASHCQTLRKEGEREGGDEGEEGEEGEERKI